jgi:hypothetical protein
MEYSISEPNGLCVDLTPDKIAGTFIPKRDLNRLWAILCVVTGHGKYNHRHNTI